MTFGPILGLTSYFVLVMFSEMILISFGFVLTQIGGGVVASGRHFEIGTVYTYDYVLGVELNEPVTLSNYSDNWHGHVSKDSGYRTGSTVGYKVLGQVQVTPVWQSENQGAILEILLIKPKLQIKSRKAPAPEGFHDHTSELDKATLHPLYVHWKEGNIHKTFVVDGDDVSLTNIKKGIANLLQFQSGKTTAEEETPRGYCNVTYENKDSSHLTKSIVSDCRLNSDADPKLREKYSKTSHVSTVLGSTTQSTVKVDLKLTANSFVEEAIVTEKHTVRVNAKKEVGATVEATQEFKLTSSAQANTPMVKANNIDSAIEEIGKAKSLKLIADSIVPHPEKIPLCEVTNCKPVDDLFAVMTSENMATAKLANAFAKLVDKFRLFSAVEVTKILKQKSDILPQLLDVCAATGTKNAYDAVMNFLKSDDAEHQSSSERFLLGLALTTFPDPAIANDLFTRVKTGSKNEKLQETLVLSTAALVHTIRSQRTSTFGQEFETFILSSLEKCPTGGENPACAQLYLRALKNLKSISTVSKLFEIVQKSDSKIGVVAMKALHALPKSFIDPSLYRSTLIRIINQLGKKYDSSTRTLAIDILLRDAPTKEEIRQLLVLQLKSPDKLHAEVGTFLWNRLHEFSITNPILETYVKEIMTEEGLRTYHHLSPRGLSTSFSRTFTSNPSGNSSFSNAIEMTGKILKRSSFDVYLHSEDNFIHPLSLGIFAGGLSSFTSSDNGEQVVVEEEPEEPTAGMELSLMGVQTRPIVFFVGKGELMGLVWSGAGSERTTALQGNALLQNERAMIPLFNGLVADLNIQGALSFDLSGQITISLWHRTANSLVQNRAGIVLQSILRVDTSFVRSRVDYTVASEATLDFTSDINFYDGVLMCLKLTQPEFTIKQNIHKTERIPGSKHRLRKAKYNSIPVAGLTYALNKKNSELCGVMYKDEL